MTFDEAPQGTTFQFSPGGCHYLKDGANHYRLLNHETGQPAYGPGAPGYNNKDSRSRSFTITPTTYPEPV